MGKSPFFISSWLCLGGFILLVAFNPPSKHTFISLEFFTLNETPSNFLKINIIYFVAVPPSK